MKYITRQETILNPIKIIWGVCVLIRNTMPSNSAIIIYGSSGRGADAPCPRMTEKSGTCTRVTIALLPTFAFYMANVKLLPLFKGAINVKNLTVFKCYEKRGLIT